MNAKDEIIDAWKQHLEDGGSDPTTLKLPLLKAYDVCKLSRDDIGELSCELFRYGPHHLEKTGLLGLKVEIVSDNDASISFV